MTFIRFIKFNYTRGLIALCMALLISACNTGENVVDVNADTGGDRSGAVVVDSGGDVVDDGANIVTIDWVAPVARADGSALSLSDIAGYRVYYGNAPGDYTNSLDVKDSSSQSTTVSVTSGLNYFVVTCLDTAGRESTYSEEFNVAI
ncbi:MAG: hypothetical protein RQ936_11045 [Gammaproteobacteria bacterium]|nr:hypothetical protein [Gammaproteobacteria bacterium]